MGFWRNCLLLLCLGATVAQDDDAVNSLVIRMFQELGRHQDQFVQRFSDLAQTQEQKDTILSLRPVSLNGVSSATESEQPDESLICIGCQLAFNILPFLVSTVGVTLNDIKSPIISLCQLATRFILTDNPFAGELVCEPLVSNFGPHVEAIARSSRIQAQDGCYRLLYCNTNVASLNIPAIIGRLLSQRAPQLTYQLATIPAVQLYGEEFKQKTYAEPSRRVRRQSGTIKIMQITDVHVDFNYKEGAPASCGLPLCCHEYPSTWPRKYLKGSAGPYGEYNCNVPPTTTKLFLDRLRQFNPDVVFHSGDNPPHSVWLETMDSQFNATKWVAAQLKNYFPNALGIYATIGNHESFPTNLYSPGHPNTAALNHLFYNTYKDLSHFTVEQEATIKYAGYYSILIKRGLRLLSVNSMFAYTLNWYNMVNRNEPHFLTMARFMRTTLQNARKNNEKVIIMVHHPAAENARDFDEAMTSIIVEFHDVIVLNFAGHIHSDEFRLFRNSSGQVVSVQHVAQSSNTFPDVNPGARIYHLDDTTFNLVDYDQYYLDINLKAAASVKKLYSAKEYYGMADLSPQSHKDLVDRMQSDQNVFMKYFRNKYTRSGVETSCNFECKVRELCGLMSSTRTLREACSAQAVASPSNSIRSSPLISSAPSWTERSLCNTFGLYVLTTGLSFLQIK